MNANAMTHPTRGFLQAYSLSKLNDAANVEILSHLAHCPQCSAEVANSSDTPPREVPPRTMSPDMAEITKFLIPVQSSRELEHLGSFRILEELGHGGMGIVFRAEDANLQREVAIKVMQPELAAKPEARARFSREARAVAAIYHDHIVPIYQVGEDQGIPFMVMPLLQGQSLETRLKQEPPLSLTEALRIGVGVALGLAAAHARGLIHRDIKPANIWLEGEPCASDSAVRVKILDFGLARFEKSSLETDGSLTREGLVLGAPAYMSPEQARGHTVDFRSDLYSLGVLLYRLIGGRLPFRAKTVTDYVVAHSTEIPRDVRELNPATPVLLADLIMQMLEKEPSKRPASAQAVAKTLDSLLLAETQPRPAVQPPHLRPRLRWPLFAAGVLVVAVLLLVVVRMKRDQTPIARPHEKKLIVLSGQTKLLFSASMGGRRDKRLACPFAQHPSQGSCRTSEPLVPTKVASAT